jgi:DNA-directed RNA polymerase specialized sigma24 family protein
MQSRVDDDGSRCATQRIARPGCLFAGHAAARQSLSMASAPSGRTAPHEGGAGSAFPVTQHSVIRALASADGAVRSRAVAMVAEIYWKPVYKYVRLRWMLGHEDSEDLTQDFFRLAFEKDWLARYDSDLARFRTFVRACVDGHVSNWRRAGQRVKRGGDVTFVAMDFGAAEQEYRDHAPAPDADVDAYFHAEWVRSVFSLAVSRLRAECEADGKMLAYTLFMKRDVDMIEDDSRPSYAALAREFGLPETQVTNFLALARRRFRQRVLDALAELSGSPEEYAEAVRDLLGIAPP